MTPVPLEPITLDIGISANTVMAPVNIEFEAKDFTDGASYFWDFGDGNSTAGTRARHTYLDAGTFVVRLSAQRGDEAVYEETTVTVQPGDAGWLLLNAQELTIESGETFQFEVEAYDHLGNQVPDAQLDWYADPAVGVIDEMGLFTAGQSIGGAAEGVQVEFIRGNAATNAKLPVEVVYGPPNSLRITPPEVDTRVTWGNDFQVDVLDAAGHVLEDAEVTWEALRPGDSIDQTGYYTPNETVSMPDASLILVTATVGDVSINEIIKGIIHPGILDRVEVDGELLELKSGDEVQLTATGYDRFGNELELDEIRWEVSDPDIGSFTEDGLFTVGVMSGDFPELTVIARGLKDNVESITDVALTILPSQAVSIEFLYESDSVPVGSSLAIPVRVLDANRNSVSDVDVLVEVTGGGSLIGDSVFRAGFVPGTYEGAIVARVPEDSAGNEEELTASMDIEVRGRSSDFLAVDIVGPRGAVIYLINLATGDFVPLSAEIDSNDFSEDSPAWWPDGSRIAYSSNVNGKREIFDIDPFFGDVRLLVSTEHDVMMPAISPDGQRIAFVQNDGENTNIYVADFVFDADGELLEAISLDDAKLLTDDPGFRTIFPYWSPSGELIMYTAASAEGRFRIVIVDAVNQFGTKIGDAMGASGLAWHPDGDKILISGSQVFDGQQRDELAVADLTNGELTPVDVGGLSVAIAAYSPDGSEISFVDSEAGALWLMDADGTGLRRALGGQYQTTETTWRPQSMEFPTSPEHEVGNNFLSMPTGEVLPNRNEDVEHGTLGPYQVVLETDRGDIRIDLFNHLAPVTVENFLNLARAGYYDGIALHTVEPGSAVFTGSRLDAFGGTAGYYILSEFHPEALHDAPGAVSMVSTMVDGASSEFVITLEPKPEWDAFVDGEPKDCSGKSAICYAVFGRVIEGLDVLMQLEQVNKLTRSVTPVRIINVKILDETEE